MNCIYERYIADYIDEALDDRTRAAFDSHLPGCGQCPAILKDVRAICAAAATLERHPVPPELWTRIATAIEAEAPARPWWQWAVMPPVVLWKPLAAAAFVLVLAIGTWSGWQRVETSRAPAVAVETAPALHESADSADAELGLAAEHYEKAIAGLEQITTTQGASLDTATSAILRSNLSVIDRAINESRAALTTEPTSVPAQESLFEALRNKVALLQDTVTLISEMPKGTQDDVPSGLNQ